MKSLLKRKAFIPSRPQKNQKWAKEISNQKKGKWQMVHLEKQGFEMKPCQK